MVTAHLELLLIPRVHVSLVLFALFPCVFVRISSARDIEYGHGKHYICIL